MNARWIPKRNSFLLLLFAICETVFGSEMLRGEIPEFAQAQIRIDTDMRYLTADDMRGRGPGTGGIDRAASYIADRFEQLGLDTHLFADSPYQSFTIPGLNISIDSVKCRLSSRTTTDRAATSEASEFLVDQRWRPLSIGRQGAFQGAVLFAGYGITADEAHLKYDDYGGVDAKGKVVILLRKEPQIADEGSPFAGTKTTAYAYFSTKVANAIEHGAAAIIFVNDRASIANEEGKVRADDDLLPGIEDAGTLGRPAPIPVIFIKRNIVDAWLQTNSEPTTLETLEKSIDSNLIPRSRDLPNVQVDGEVALNSRSIQLKNVIASIEGQGSLASETVVIGAHYDHVGMGGVGSLSPGIVAVHNGADDNASGTAALLELSRKFSDALVHPGPSINASATLPRRRLVLIAFSGEERGLLGSKYYVKHPRYALESIAAMINLDMVGRMSNRQLIVFGTGSSGEFPTLLNNANASTSLELKLKPEALGPSDHQPFFERKIPVLHFFTGLHSDYHRPSDDFEKINIAGIGLITDIVYQVATDLTLSSQRPNYIAVAGRADIKTFVDRKLKLGVSLKLISSDRVREAGPETSAEEATAISIGKVEIESIVADSPAARFGLQRGDQILSIDGLAINTPNDVGSALDQKSVGETIKLDIARDSVRSELSIRLDP